MSQMLPSPHVTAGVQPYGGRLTGPGPKEIVVPRRKNRRKTNSERGKEFRAKKKDHESSLLEMINSLRDEVRDLHFLHQIRSETMLVSRSSIDGSLARLVKEYFSLFATGRPTLPGVGAKRNPAALELIAKQNSFVRAAMDSEMKFGFVVGAAALLNQWERYTLYHSSFRISLESMEVMASEESPIITVTSSMSVTLSRETFKHIFPHVAHDEALMGRLVGKEITYRGVNSFQFGADRQHVLVYDSDVDFVNAYLTAGVSLEDVSTLMKQALISDQHLLGKEPTSPQIEVLECSEDATFETITDDTRQKRPRQGIAYLLN